MTTCGTKQSGRRGRANKSIDLNGEESDQSTAIVRYNLASLFGGMFKT